MDDSTIQSCLDLVRALQRGERLPEITPAGPLAPLVAELEELGKHLRTREVLMRITTELLAGVRLEEVLDHLFESFSTVIPYDRIGVALLEERGTRVRARWARSVLPEIHLRPGYAAPLSGSSLAEVIRTGQPRILNDLQAHARMHPGSDSTRLILREGLRSSLTCPLVSLGSPLGFIFFSSARPGAYRDAHVDLYQQIAGRLALILERSRLYDELVELGELRDRFLGVVAHDLRNPLSIIQGYLRVVAAGQLGDLTAAQQAALGRLETPCQTMLALVDDLLDFSAIQTGHLELRTETIELGRYLEECLLTQGVLALPKQIDLQLRLEDDLPPIEGDPRRLGQVLGNLIGNAIKFSPAGSSVTLGAARRGDQVAVSVEDTGPGIPPEEVAGLFEAYQRTSVKPSAGERSTGLGLAIARRIVEAHGGHVEVDSEVGRGSIFTVLLPL